jgi:hypothetical protein
MELVEVLVVSIFVGTFFVSTKMDKHGLSARVRVWNFHGLPLQPVLLQSTLFFFSSSIP